MNLMDRAANAYMDWLWYDTRLSLKAIRVCRKAHARRVKRKAHRVREGDGFAESMTALRKRAHGNAKSDIL